MDPSSSRSFIPKKTIRRTKRVRGSRRVFVLEYISYAIFGGTVLVAGFVFAYTQILQSTLNQRINDLAIQRDAFNQDFIDEIQTEEQRLRLTEFVYGQHASVGAILADVAAIVSRDVVFSDFSYARTASESGAADTIEVNVEGGADQFDAVAFQERILNKSTIFTDSEISDVSKGDTQKSSEEGAQSQSSQDSSAAATKPITFSLSADLSVADIPYNPAVYNAVPGSSSTVPIQSDTEAVTPVSEPVDDQTVTPATESVDDQAAGSDSVPTPDEVDTATQAVEGSNEGSPAADM